jgi:hypothetical protein
MLPDLKFDIVAIDKSLGAFRSVQTSMSRMNAETKALNVGAATLGMQFSAIGKGLLIGGAITGLVAMGREVRQIVGDTADLFDQAERIGVGVEFLQELRFGAERAGADIATLDAGLAEFSRNLALAASGAGGNFAKVLEDNGVALRDVNGNLIPLNEQVRRYADLIENARSESEKLLLTQVGFGKGAGDLKSFFSGGTEEIERQADARRALGPLITEEDRALKAIDDQWKDIANTISFQVKGAIIDLVPVINDVNGAMKGLRESLGIEAFFDKVGEIKRQLGIPAVNIPGFGSPEFNAERFSTGFAPFAPAGDTTDTILNLGKGDGAKADRAQDRIDRVVESLKLQTENLFRTNREQEIYNNLAKAGVEIDSEWGKVVAELSGRFHDQSEALSALNEQAEFFGDTISDALSDLIFKGESFEDVMRRVAVQIGEAALQASLMGTGPLAGLFGTAAAGGGAGGILGSLFKAILPGFKDGGSFTVPGAGGTDSQFVGFMASPGERVSIDRGRGGDRAGIVDVTISVDRNGNLVPVITSVSGDVAAKVTREGITQFAKQQARERQLGG